MATTFRRCDPGNLGRAAELIRIVHALEGVAIDIVAVEQMLAGIIVPGGAARVWAIEQDGATAGYLVIEAHPRNGFLWREASIRALYVRPNFRERGIPARARAFARTGAEQMGACLRWRQLHREDASLIQPSAPGTVYQPRMVAA